MPLFNPKVLTRAKLQTASMPETHLQVLTDWAESIRLGRIYAQSETALHSAFKSRIVEGVLGYKPFSAEGHWTCAAEHRIGRGSVDLALGHFGDDEATVVAPFELKGAGTKDLDAIMPGHNKSPVQQAWDYAIAVPGCKWVLVSNYVELRLYAFGEGIQNYEHFNFASLREPDEYARFILLLDSDNLLSGRTEQLLQESREADIEITNALYDDSKNLRMAPLTTVLRRREEMHQLQAISLSQKTLDRILFIVFAEDTGLLPKQTLMRAYDHRDPYNPRPVWDNFRGLFRAINTGNKELSIPRYNGGLFADDALLDALELPDEICERFRTLGRYDFESEISVTVLGHIFEQSIVDIERLQARARGEKPPSDGEYVTEGRRKRDGIVYTPRLWIEHLAHIWPKCSQPQSWLTHRMAARQTMNQSDSARAEIPRNGLTPRFAPG
jgi:hypothetical protein